MFVHDRCMMMDLSGGYYYNNSHEYFHYKNTKTKYKSLGSYLVRRQKTDDCLVQHLVGRQTIVGSTLGWKIDDCWVGRQTIVWYNTWLEDRRLLGWKTDDCWFNTWLEDRQTIVGLEDRRLLSWKTDDCWYNTWLEDRRLLSSRQKIG